jgi:hypothetical protein
VEEHKDDVNSSSSEDSDTSEDGDNSTDSEEPSKQASSKRVTVSSTKRIRVSSSSSNGNSGEEENRGLNIKKIVAKLKGNFKQKKVQPPSSPEETSHSEDEDQLAHPAPEPFQDQPAPDPFQEPAPEHFKNLYPPESFVVALYQGEWFMGQVMRKEGEPEADQREDYVLVSFMERTTGDLLKWPRRLDILNVLKVRMVPYPTVEFFPRHTSISTALVLYLYPVLESIWYSVPVLHHTINLLRTYRYCRYRSWSVWYRYPT